MQDKADAERALPEFKAKWSAAAPKFYTYFDKEWVAARKFVKWIAAFRDPDTPNTTSALEAYHGVIKLLFASTRYVWVLQEGFTRGFYKPVWVLQPCTAS